MLHQDLCAAKVTQFQDTCAGIEKEVLWFDITMAYALGVNVCERSEKLVDVEFDLKDRHGGLHLAEISRCAIHGFGNVLEDKIEIYFVLLRLLA